MILEKLWESRATFSRADPKDPVVASWFGGRSTGSGVQMTPTMAMQLTAVYACVRILAESVAGLPLVLMRSVGNRKEPAIAHPLYQTLKMQPNRHQTSFEWREMMMAHAVLRGRAYSEIVSTPSRPARELIPRHPDRVRPFEAPDGTTAYEYTPAPGTSRVILWHEMHVLQGMSIDDWLSPLDPTETLREALGLTYAVEQHGARFFGNGARPGVVLEHPGQLSDEAQARLIKAWEARHQGVERLHRTTVLEEGMTIKEVGIDPEKSQLLESRKFNVTDIARIFRVPPHMLADLERATFSNIEHQSLEFVIHTLRPWLVRWEQALYRDLLTTDAKKTHFFRFNVDSLLRGDIKTRYEAYRVGREWGWLTVNDILGKEDMNPVDGGDQRLVPMNMTTPEKLGLDMQPDQQAAAERVARKEFKALTKAVRAKNVPEWLDGFVEKHTRWATDVLGRDSSAVVDRLRAGWKTLPADEDEFISERAAQYLELWHG